MRASRNFVKNLLQQLNFKVETIETDLHPILWRSALVSQNGRTSFCMPYYDVQPARTIYGGAHPLSPKLEVDACMVVVADNKANEYLGCACSSLGS